MSSTRIFRSIAAPVSKLSSVGPVRTIYSGSHPDEMRHWIEMHNHHTDGHKHYGALFVDHHGHHGIQGSRHMHSEPAHHANVQKSPSHTEDTHKEFSFRAW